MNILQIYKNQIKNNKKEKKRFFEKMSKLLFRIFLTFLISLNLSDVYSMIQVNSKENIIIKIQESSFKKSYNIVESFKANENLQNSNKAFRKIDKIIKNQKERIELFN